MMTLLQAATTAPTSWELIVAIAGAAGLLLTCAGAGVIYGKVVARLEAVEAALKEAKDNTVPRSEVLLMFDDIKNRLKRIEEEVTEQRVRDR